jgi:hypothetical protein
MPAAPFAAVHFVSDPAGRLPIPKEAANQIGWLKGAEPVPAWLWLVSEGRYRLLTTEEVQADPMLSPLFDVITNGHSGERPNATEAQSDIDAAMMSRLIPITISPPKPAWRINVPKTVASFAPADSDMKHFSILFGADGYWEIWHTEALRRAASQNPSPRA